MNSAKIQKQISRTEKEISSLQERQQQTEEKLSGIKKDLKNLETDEARKLQSNLSILKDVISEKETDLERLRAEAAKARAEEAKADAVKRMISFAKKAKALQEQDEKAFEEISGFLEKAIPGVVENLKQWRGLNSEFLKIADQYGMPDILPAVESETWIDPVLSRRIYSGIESRGSRQHPDVLFEPFIAQMIEAWMNPGSLFRKKLKEAGYDDYLDNLPTPANLRTKLKSAG